MVKRFVDACFVVTNEAEIKRCLEAVYNGQALKVGSHFGFVTQADVEQNGRVTVTLRHTGPQVCNCRQKVRNDQDE